MATSSDWTLTGLDNPLTIQQALLSRFENETGAAVVDNNNPACVLMEAFASISSKQMKMMDDTVRPAIYPARAVTTTDLLKHISDYDYVDIFSAPCTATILLIVEKNYIMTHSLDVPDQKYKRLEIPRSTIISIGEHKFGLYYPIEFRTDINSGRFSVLYDTTVENPLKTLETNVLDFEFREYNGLKLAYIKIPVYQFDITCHDLQMINSSGFKQKVDYENRFYALRCWADVLQNFGHDDDEDDVYERQELDLAVAGQAYDPTVPTVVFTPDEEDKECLLEVPYIYFTEKRIRGTLHVEIYTTEGELNYQVPYNTEETCIIDMLSNISADEDDTYNASYYAEPFRQMPGLHALPLSSTITGGSNGLDFDEIRYRVINGANTTVLQTPADISAYFASYGYTATLYRDGITDRIFIVHAAVRDNDDEVIGMDCVSTQFDFSNLDEYSTIIKSEDSSSTYTVLPSTLYRFDTDKQICVPLTDTEKSELDGYSAADRVTQYNNNVFTLSPFHLQINASKRYPTTITYDMLQVKRMARTFIAARNDQYGLALNTVNLDVHRRDGDNSDRYRLTFRVNRVGFDAETIPVMETSEQGQAEKKIRVLVGLKNDDGEMHWAEAQWISTEAGDTSNATNEVFELILTPNYIFHQANNEHTVQMAFWDDDTYSDFFLTSECRVLLMMKNNLIINTESGEMITFDDEQSLSGGTSIGSGQVVLPTSKRVSINSEVGFANYYVMTEQKCVFKFGSPIDELDQRINLTYSEAVYKKHLTTKFRTLEEPKYKKDEKGDLIVEYVYSLPDQNSYLTKDITYYVKQDEEWVPTTFPEASYNTVKVKDCGKDVYIRSSVPTIVELYPAGTLTCMTVSGEELVIPNKYTAANYLGHTKITEVEGEEVESEITQEDLTTAISTGASLSIKDSPIAPRFLIESAAVEGVVGKFELQNALTAKPISSLDNVWAKTGYSGSFYYSQVDTSTKPISTTKYYVVEDPTSTPKVYRAATSDDFKEDGSFKTDREFYTLELSSKTESEAFRSNYRISACNALLHVLNDLVVVKEASTGDDPLNDLYEAGSTFEAGTLLLLENDYSTPTVMQIQETLGEAPASKVYTRLYYKFRVRTDAEIEAGLSEKFTWLCIVQGKSRASMIEQLTNDAKEGTYYTATTDTVRNLTKTYYIKSGDTYREAVESDFSETGAFVVGTTYYEKREYNPKYYGFMYTLDQVREQSAGSLADVVENQLYVAFQTTTTYTSRLTNYELTEDETAIASKRYYIAYGDSYREATDDDFNADGSFIDGVSYYEQKVTTGTYNVPDFAMMEKSAWEAHEIKLESTDVTVVEGRTYYYLNKDLYDAGVRKWVNLNEERGLIKDHPINEYIDISTETGDGVLYYAKSKAECTDHDYAWEQNANRWPWEMSNWLRVTRMYDPADSVTIKYLYLTTDSTLVVTSDYDRARRYWEYSTEQVILDEDFYPLEDYTQPRSIQYLVDMLQMDAKHAQVTANKEDTRIASDFGDDGPTANTFPTTIVNVLRTHFDNVGKARDTMFTNTRLFFEPVKSLGFASFNVGNNITKELQLDITMKFRLHVTKEAYEDDILLEQMKSRIIAIIDEHIDGGYVNCAEIAAKITSEMDGTVKWVDILGINGDSDLQTMKCDDEDVLPHLAHKLVLSSDGTTIDITRGLTIEAVVNE